MFDFVANRVLAHRFRGDAWVLVAGAGLDKVVPWGKQVVISTRPAPGVADPLAPGRPVALLGRRSSLAIPERANDGDALRLSVYAAEADRLIIDSMGERLATVDVAPGWQQLSVELSSPARARLALRPRRSLNVGVAALALGRDPASLPDLEPPPPPNGLATLELGASDSLSYYVYVPVGAALSGEASGGCAIEARAITDDGAEASGSIDGDGAGAPIELGDVGGAVARIDVSLADCDGGAVEHLALIADVPEAPEMPEGPPPKHVLLWVMDTLRADRLELFNPGARPEIPGMERLAARGVVFQSAWTQGNESQTSHASIWTSTYPATHGIRSAGNNQSFLLPGRLPVFGELLERSGRRVIGLTANGMVTRGGGYARGFSRFENPMRDGTGERRNGWIPAERLMRRALELLEVQDGPHAFFFGTIDTHKPWVGHQPWLDRYDPGPYRGKFSRAAWPRDLGLVRGSMRCTDIPKKRDLQRIKAIYDSAISYQDQALDRMLTWLEDKGRLDDTLIILTADHGEELWEVGRCGHGASLRETLQWVPLIVSYPGRLPSGVVVSEGVDTLDILPTVLELLDAEAPSTFQGASLVGLVAGEGRGYPRASYASQYEYAHAMRIGRYKLRVGRDTRLYDLEADPEERESLAFERWIAQQHVADALQLFLRHRDRWKKGAWGPANNLTPAGAAALEEARGGS